MSPEELIVKLEREALAGWPRPFWPQDQPDSLDAYIAIVGDVVAAGRAHANDCFHDRPALSPSTT